MSTQTIARRLGPYTLLVPALLVLGIAMGYPLVRQVVMSFQEYGRAQQFGQPAPFVGLDNYVRLFTDAQMWAVIGRSLAFCAVNVLVTMLVGVALALLLRRVSRACRLILQIAMLLAWAMPVIAAMTSWQWLFDTRYGVINWLLVRLGFESFDGHNWLTNPLSFYFVATVVVVWMSVPFVMFTVYAALTQVSEEALEAGQLDGASAWQRFRHIVYPTIRPVLTITLLLQVVWDLRVFAQIYYLQGVGGTPSKTHLLGTYIYTLGIGQSDYGMASALAMFVLVLTLVLTAGYVRALLKESR
ncbi:carbohydrate ABC transporter permease [Aeromicrobium sp. 179-A 4D2 NHS]|uniref:carbohydrate ABC transporter permease n=1 Tax=Aeromicrobium sp. 179-A 4D2 NHS TaxID=3142375 RepID=UPI0039A3ED75